MENNYTQHL